MYDDRLEIESPGMLYDGLTPAEAVAGKSRCRNKAIAEAFQYMKLIEGWGTGLPSLYQRCKEMGLQIPKFEEAGTGSGSRFTVLPHWVLTRLKAVNIMILAKKMTALSKKLAKKLPKKL